MAKLEVGKLDSDVLQSVVIDKITLRRPEVLTRAAIGEDCAEVDFGEYTCIVSTDPITADVKDVGRLAVYISCNDIASDGIEPIAITLAVMLPEGTTEEQLSMIMAQANLAAYDCNVEIIGGHTEVTPSVNQPVIVSTTLGRRVKAEHKKYDVSPGDMILMTKSAAMEGTGILATDKAEELSKVLTEKQLRHAQGMLDNISVIPEGVIAGKIGVSAMHDVTEGGILGAVWEICTNGNVGAIIEEEAIHVDPVTEKVADHFGIDYKRLISSGCMIIVAPPGQMYKVVTEFHRHDVDIKTSIIGTVTAKEDGIMLLDAEGEKSEIGEPRADELYKALAAAQ